MTPAERAQVTGSGATSTLWPTIEAPLMKGELFITVYGEPKPQGSMRSFRHAKTGAVITTGDNPGTKPWKQQVAQVALSMNLPQFEPHVPVYMAMNFYFSRPKSVSAKKRPAMTTKPDGDKLVRAIFDALKGIVIHDDSQVIEHHCRKHYGGPPRVEIRIQAAIV